jgi:hypothetical protein
LLLTQVLTPSPLTFLLLLEVVGLVMIWVAVVALAAIVSFLLKH